MVARARRGYPTRNGAAAPRTVKRSDPGTAAFVLALLTGPLAPAAPGQAGDHAGEEQAPLPEWL
jgi:hypothetical protein